MKRSFLISLSAANAKLGKAIDMELKNVRKGQATSNTTESDEDNYVLINFFYFNVL